MLREKLIATMAWSALCVAGAMLVDYLVTVVILNDRANYTPWITLVVATRRDQIPPSPNPSTAVRRSRGS